LGDDYSLPEGVTLGENVVYGESMKGGADVFASKEHVTSLLPAVSKLNELQVQSQINYWNLQNSFTLF
jgi:hypothetical protein